MRKRPILLAAAVAAAGLAALSTVAAQQPSSGYTQPTVTPASGTQPVPTTRRYSDWTPTPPPPGYVPTQPTQPVQPAGGTGTRLPGGGYVPPPAGSNAPYYPSPPGASPSTRPRLAAPGVAGGAPVRPAGGFDMPPPSMELPGSRPPTGTPTLSPPSVSVDPGNKFAPPGGIPPAPPSNVVPPPSNVIPPLPPSFPVPPAPAGNVGGTPKPLPSLPATPLLPPTGTPKPLPPLPGAAMPTPAATTGATVTAALPSRISQSVTVEAVCPASVVYDQNFEYQLVVRNTGNVAVKNVRVEDEIPAAARYVSSDPPGEMNGDRLVWSVGTIDANAEKRIVVRLRPTEEGELRSRATVSFVGSVDAKMKVTRPRVTVTVSCPEVCRAGENAIFQIKVSNTGTGPAEKMVLRATMTDGLYYPKAGGDTKPVTTLESELDKLPAGQTKTLNLPLNAIKAGLQSCRFMVTAAGSADATAKASVNVVEPLLRIAQTGPAKCLVRAEPTYEITLTNPGTAATDKITLDTVLPDGFEYVQGSDAATFNATTRAISWKLDHLPAGGSKAVAVKVRAAAAGDVVLRSTAYTGADPAAAAVPAGGALPVKPAGRLLEAKADTSIKAEGVAAVRFEVAGLENPVEVGKEAVYEIRVINQGTCACTNVQLLAEMATGATHAGTTGTQVKVQGQTLVFEKINTLPVKDVVVYRVRVRGNSDGYKRFRVQLTCDQVRTPVVKEESTRFYKE